MAKFEEVLNDLKNKIFSQVYLFHGEEPYYTDVLTAYMEKNVLDEMTREFNQTVIYGKDTTPTDVIHLARQFPMMGDYQLVIIKESQDLKKIEELQAYLDSPMSTTILVISYKHKKLDKRKALYKKLAKSKSAVIFESERIRDYEVPGWIEKTIHDNGYSIGPVASRILSEYLGNDLGKIINELQKLMINLKPGSEITELEIEQNIGISKDFNIFEFQTALWQRNALKAQRIVNYFEANPKQNPLQLISVMLHNFFMKIFLFHQLRNMEDRKIAAELGINPYFVKEYRNAAKVFPPGKIKTVISQIKDLDLKSKGVDSSDAKDYGELKELVYKIMH